MTGEFYGCYKGVRNASWDLLARFGACRLPVSSFEIARQMGVPTLSYEKAMPLLRELALLPHCRDNDGFALHSRDFWCIFFDGRAELRPTRDFTLAHELGHVFLGHRMEEKEVLPHKRIEVSRRNRPSSGAGIEREADMFAARILSPACVLWALSLRTPEDLTARCGLPPEVAHRRAARMEELYRRDLFLRDRRERALFLKFIPYLEAQSPGGVLPEHCRRRLEATSRPAKG